MVMVSRAVVSLSNTKGKAPAKFLTLLIITIIINPQKHSYQRLSVSTEKKVSKDKILTSYHSSE